MEELKRDKIMIEWEINKNNQEGVHTFIMCKCKKGIGHRGSTRACNECLKKELEELE